MESNTLQVDSKLMKMEGFKNQVDLNQQSIDTLKDHFTQTVSEMSELIKNVQRKTQEDINYQAVQLNNYYLMFKDLPSLHDKSLVRIKDLESANMNNRHRLDKLFDRVTQVTSMVEELQTFNAFKVETKSQMLAIEKTVDTLENSIKTLENWIDIYMPLRLQHQITETIKPTLSTVKAKTLLSKVDSLIVANLKERVAQDMGDPQLIERVNEVISRLELDVQILDNDSQYKIKRLKNKLKKDMELDDDE